MPTAADFATLPRNIALVAVFNTAIAAGIALSRQGGFAESMIYSQCIGLLCLLSMDVPRRLIWGAEAPPRAQQLFLSGRAAMFAGGSFEIANFRKQNPKLDLDFINSKLQQLVTDLTRGVGADEALVTVGVVTEDVIDAAFAAIRKHGTVIVTGLAGPGKKNIHLSSFELTLFQKRLEGALFGGGNPFDDIPLMLDLYRAGRLKLDELITTRYRLDEVNQGYRDLLDGRNIRGVLIHDH